MRKELEAFRVRYGHALNVDYLAEREAQRPNDPSQPHDVDRSDPCCLS